LVLSPACLSDGESNQVVDEWVEDLKRVTKKETPIARSRGFTGLLFLLK
jgi:hypothetical protein